METKNDLINRIRENKFKVSQFLVSAGATLIMVIGGGFIAGIYFFPIPSVPFLVFSIIWFAILWIICWRIPKRIFNLRRKKYTPFKREIEREEQNSN